MKLGLLGAEHLYDAILIVADDLGITVADVADADAAVTVNEAPTDTLTVTLTGRTAAVSYGGGISRFLRGLAHLTAWVRDGISERSVTETPHFDTNGAMVDVSRNAVLTVDAVKLMLRKMALMGLNTFMLYLQKCDAA